MIDENHPLHEVLLKAIEQVTKGKGVRHGGDSIPFLEQPWLHYAKMHGRGFLTGQAAKKLEEAATKRSGEQFETEVLGAIVYCALSILYERMQGTAAKAEIIKKRSSIQGFQRNYMPF